MKKFTLLLCLCFVALLLSQKVMANAVLSNNGATLTITTNAAGQVSGFVSSFNSDQKSAVTTIVLDGVFNSDDLNSISTNSGFSSVTLTVSVSGTTLTVTSSTAGLLNTFMQSVGSEGHVSSDYLAKMQGCTKIVLSGTFSSGNPSDLSSIQASGSYFNAKEVDMTDAVFYTSNNNNNTNNFKLFSGSSTDQGASTFAKAIFNASLYQSTSLKSWQGINDPGEGNATLYESLPSTADVGQKAAVKKSDTYKYYQLVVTPSGWSSAKVGAPGIAGYEEKDTWAENELNSHINDGPVKVRLYRYYKIIQEGETKKWTSAQLSDWTYAEGDNNLSTFTAGVGDAAEATEANLNDHAWFAVGSCIRFCIYFDKVFNRSWYGDGTLPSGTEEPSTVESFDYNYRDNHISDFNDTESSWKKMPVYDYYQYQATGYTWGNENANISFTEGEERYISQHVSSFSSLSSPGSEGQLAVVSTSGTSDIKVYNGTSWVENNSSLQVYDNSAAKFEYWKDYIETAHLPSFIDPATCPSSVLQYCKKLTKLYKGTYFAERTDNVTEGVTTVTVEATAPNLFKLLLNAKATERYADGTKFKFTSNSNISAEDLVVFVDDNNIHYYVDLFDINARTNTTIEGVVRSAINSLSSQERYLKGLLLPQNPTEIGTTLIKGSSRSTCSEFIAYYYNYIDENNSNNNYVTTTMHIYAEHPENNDANYDTKLTTLVNMMNEHKDNSNNPIIASTTNAYLVSSNSQTRISNVASLLQTQTPSKTIIETINNEMVGATIKKPSIYATLINAGDFKKVVDNTGVENTPNVDVFQFLASGGTGVSVANESDIAAVNGFVTGPSVLNLKDVTSATITKELLNSLTNTALEYIILPAGMSEKAITDADYSDLTNLKTVISSNSSVLVAYVKVPGSLAKARCLVTGNNRNNLPDNSYISTEPDYPSTKGLTTVTLSGNLYAQDITTKEAADALYHENWTITSIDLTDAVFYKPNVTEYVDGEWVTHDVADSQVMNFHDAGYADRDPKTLTDVKLPIDRRMKVIGRECFKNITSLTNVCIPYSFTHILGQSFLDTGVNHITTTDANGAVIDNGELTYTFSANVQELGTKGNTLRTFPQNVGVSDVYCLATKVPVCYANVFPDNFLFGFGGFDQTMVYCREKYHNPSGDGYVGTDKIDGAEGQMIGVLHFPSLESFNIIEDSKLKESSYEEMKKKYTDPYRLYTKKDQTGAVDANGEPLLWPTRTEMNHAYNSATDGNVWSDYNYEYNGSNLEEISATLKSGNGPNHYNFDDYIGWHQITLAQATYVDKNEIVENDTIKRYYEDAGWFTFCIPFDMTYSQVVKMLGVPASTGIVENYYDGKKVENNDSMPDIRQLKSVIRTPNKNNTDTNEILFRLTSNLADKGNKTAKYYNFSESGDYWVPVVQTAAKEGETDKRCLVGGRPYIIKAYKRQGETIADANLGKYILTRYADEFTLAASCVNTVGTYEQLCSYKTSEGNVVVDQENLVTMKFAKPYENHKVQAYLNSDTDGGQLMFKDSKGVDHPYFYAMVGQFWQQDLPQYCVYMTRSQAWKLYTDPNKGFVWDPYKCVIMATPELTTTDRVLETTLTADTAKTVVGAVTESLIPNATAQTVIIDESKKLGTPTDYASDFNRWGGGFRYVPFCYFPMNYDGTYDWIPAPMTLWFFGRNDDSFTNQFTKNSSPTRYVFSLDGDDDIFDYGDEATAVKTIETLNGETQLSGSTRVYSLSGQYMGNTTEGLSKGVYIVGGRKIVVE